MPDNGMSGRAYTEGGTDMRGRRRRDDGWDDGAGQQGQDDGQGTWSSGLPEDWTKRNRTDSFVRLDQQERDGAADAPSAAGAFGAGGASAGDWPAAGDWPGVTGYQRADGPGGAGGGAG